MKFTAGDIAACEPVNKLLTILCEKGFAIEKSKVEDYHFNELYFLLKGGEKDNYPEEFQIENIEKQSSNAYYCTCHWSIVEICKSINL